MQKFAVIGEAMACQIDKLGNVYISNGQGVMATIRVEPHPEIPTGSGATNDTFASNNKILFITGPVDKVTAVKMNVKGAANW